ELAGFGLLRATQRIARDATAHVLDEAGIGRHDRAAIGLAAAAHGPLLENVVLHVRQDFAVMLVLVVMSIHVDDEDVVELALDRLFAGVSEKPGVVQLVDRYASTAFSEEVHVRLLTFTNDVSQIPGGQARPGDPSAAGPALPHAELEHRKV